MKTYTIDEKNPPHTNYSRGYSTIVDYVRDMLLERRGGFETKATSGWSGVDESGRKLCFVPDGTSWPY